MKLVALLPSLRRKSFLTDLHLDIHHTLHSRAQSGSRSTRGDGPPNSNHMRLFVAHQDNLCITIAGRTLDSKQTSITNQNAIIAQTNLLTVRLGKLCHDIVLLGDDGNSNSLHSETMV